MSKPSMTEAVESFQASFALLMDSTNLTTEEKEHVATMMKAFHFTHTALADFADLCHQQRDLLRDYASKGVRTE